MLKAKLDKHDNFYHAKFEQYLKMDMGARSLRRLSRLALHASLTSKMAAEYINSLAY